MVFFPNTLTKKFTDTLDAIGLLSSSLATRFETLELAFNAVKDSIDTRIPLGALQTIADSLGSTTNANGVLFQLLYLTQNAATPPVPRQANINSLTGVLNAIRGPDTASRRSLFEILNAIDGLEASATATAISTGATAASVALTATNTGNTLSAVSQLATAVIGSAANGLTLAQQLQVVAECICELNDKTPDPVGPIGSIPTDHACAAEDLIIFSVEPSAWEPVPELPGSYFTSQATIYGVGIFANYYGDTVQVRPAPGAEHEPTGVFRGAVGQEAVQAQCTTLAATNNFESVGRDISIENPPGSGLYPVFTNVVLALAPSNTPTGCKPSFTLPAERSQTSATEFAQVVFRLTCDTTDGLAPNDTLLIFTDAVG